MLTNYKYQLNFNLILDIPPEKQGVRQNWTIYDIGNWIFNISLQGGVTSSSIIQMCIALPISMFIVKASILIEKILRAIPFFSFVLLGDLKFISTNIHNYRTLIVKKIWRKK